MGMQRVLTVIIALVLVTAACSGGSVGGSSSPSSRSTTATESASGGKTITLGLVTEAWDNPAIKDMADAAIAQAKAKGVKLLAQDSSNIQDEITKAQTLISQKVDGLGLEPWDGAALIPTINGLLTVGPSIPECFNNHYRLERACQLQVMTLSCNTEIQLPPDEVVQSTYAGFKSGMRQRWGLLEWPSLLRKLDRIDPGYAS